jgi:hypothetical protein
MGFRWPSEIFTSARSASWVPRPRLGLARRWPARSSAPTLPPVTFDFLRLRTLLALRPLQSMTRSGRCSSLECSPSLGVCLPSALAVSGAQATGVASPGPLRLQGSSPLGAFLLPQPPRPCFMPRTPMGFVPFEAFPFAERELASRRPLPLWPLARTGTELPPRPSPGSRGFLPPEVRHTPAERSRQVVRGSLGLHSSSGVPPARDGPRLPARLLSRAWPQPAPQSLDHDRAGTSPERPPPLLRFSHLVPAPAGSRLLQPGLMDSPRRPVTSRPLGPR